MAISFSQSGQLGDSPDSSVVFDEFISMPDDDEVSPKADTDVRAHAPPLARSNAMSLDFILTVPSLAPHGRHSVQPDVLAPSRPHTQLSFYAVREERELPVPAATCASASQPIATVRGWAPTDGRPYITLDYPLHPFAPRETITQPTQGAQRLRLVYSAPRPADQRWSPYARPARDGDAYSAASQAPPRSSQPLYHPGPQHNTSRDTRLLAADATGGGAPRRYSVSLAYMERASRQIPRPPQQVLLPLAAPPPSAAHRFGHAEGRPRAGARGLGDAPHVSAPPAPRGGVAPALARTISHIRVARERADYLAKVQAARERSALVPSVMGQWTTAK